MTSSDASLDPALARDTRSLIDLPHARVLLARDARWPWLILVPRNPDATELHELDENERTGFLAAVSATSAALQNATGCRSINVAMLGNVVRQLHCHVVARDPGDPNWPGPIWGFGDPEPRPDDAPEPDFATAVRHALENR